MQPSRLVHIESTDRQTATDHLKRGASPFHFEEYMTKRKRMRGTVEKIIKSQLPNQPEKAEITIEGADALYREIRIENVLTGEQGDEAQLKPGAEVNVVVEADSSVTTKKPEKT